MGMFFGVPQHEIARLVNVLQCVRSGFLTMRAESTLVVVGNTADGGKVVIQLGDEITVAVAGR